MKFRLYSVQSPLEILEKAVKDFEGCISLSPSMEHTSDPYITEVLDKLISQGHYVQLWLFRDEESVMLAHDTQANTLQISDGANIITVSKDGRLYEVFGDLDLLDNRAMPDFEINRELFLSKVVIDKDGGETLMTDYLESIVEDFGDDCMPLWIGTRIYWWQGPIYGQLSWKNHPVTWNDYQAIKNKAKPANTVEDMPIALVKGNWKQEYKDMEALVKDLMNISDMPTYKVRISTVNGSLYFRPLFS